MTPFQHPKPGENQKDFDARREAMIAFLQRRHAWPRERTIEFLQSLDHVGIAYVGVDMKDAERNERRANREYDPFAECYRGI